MPYLSQHTFHAAAAPGKKFYAVVAPSQIFSKQTFVAMHKTEQKGWCYLVF
jgi:hypothetical protein